MSTPASSGKAQSNSSIAVPSAALTASGISSRLQVDRLSGPSICPEAMRNSSGVADLAGGAGDGDLTGLTFSVSSVGVSFQARCHRCCRFSSIGVQELLGGQELLVVADEQREVLGHLAALHRLHADALERLGERRHVGRAVHPPAVCEPARPREDRRDRVGGGRLALLVLAEVAGDGAVRGLGLDGLAVGRHQHARHQPERAEALGDGVGLHVAVVVLARPHVAALPLQRGGHHVVDQAVLVGEAGGLEVGLELGVEDLLEQVLEAPVVALHDRVLGRQVDRAGRGPGRSASTRARSRGSSRRGCTSPSRPRRRGSRRRELDRARRRSWG